MRILIVLLGWLVLCAPPREAQAHAVLIDTVPRDGQVLATAPSSLQLRFNERVTPIVIALRNQQGTVIPALRTEAVDTVLTVALPAGLADGFYVLSYRVTSADSHPVTGSTTFVVGAGAKPDLAAPVTDHERPWRWLGVANRLVFLSTAMIAGGGLLSLCIFGVAPVHRGLGRLLRGSALAATATAILGIGLQGYLLMGDDSSLLDMQAWHVGLQSTRGVALLVAAACMAAILVGLLPVAKSLRVIVGLLGLGGFAATFALSGHAATGAVSWLGQPVVAIHVVLAAAWLGSFLPLLVRLRQEGSAAVLLQDFSALALPAVAILIAAGATLGLLRVPSFASLLSTGYGQTLLLKVALVTAMLGLAATNRFVLVPRHLRNPNGIRQLRVSVRAELALGLLVLAATAWLSQSVPPGMEPSSPEPESEAAGDGYSLDVPVRGNTMTLSVRPGRPGIVNTITVTFTDSAGATIPLKEAEMELSMPELGIEPLRRPMTQTSPGTFVYRGRDLALEGGWTVRIRALVNDFELLTAGAELHVH